MKTRTEESHAEADGPNENELQYPEEAETKHCKEECKYGGDDKKSDAMIECCLCKRWYHVKCVGITDTENEVEGKSVKNPESENEKVTEQDETTTDEECPGEEIQDGGEEEDEVTANQETDEQKEKEVDQEEKSFGQDKALDMKIWICENCSNIPKKTDKILKSLLDLQHELKSMKSNVDEILKTQKNNNLNQDSTAEPAPPAKEKDCDCGSKREITEEKDGDYESKRKIIEENIILKRDNKELKERLIILERVLDQVLRDQEEKRSLKLENREESKWRKVKTGQKFVEHKQFGLEKSNSFDVLSDVDETDNSEAESTLSDTNVFDYKRKRTRPRVRSKQSKKENSRRSQEDKQSKSDNSRKTHVKRTEDSTYEKDRGKILIIGDSQLHHIEESRLSGKNIKALVRSKGGLKVEQVTKRYEELLSEEFDEIILHVGVNNTEHESEEDKPL